MVAFVAVKKLSIKDKIYCLSGSMKVGYLYFAGPWIALFVKGENNYEWSDGSTYIRSGAKSSTKFYIGYGACGFLYRGEIRSRYCKNGYEYLCEILVA